MVGAVQGVYVGALNHTFHSIQNVFEKGKSRFEIKELTIEGGELVTVSWGKIWISKRNGVEGLSMFDDTGVSSSGLSLGAGAGTLLIYLVLKVISFLM